MVRIVDVIKPIQGYYDKSHKFREYKKNKDKIKKYQEVEKNNINTGKIVDFKV